MMMQRLDNGRQTSKNELYQKTGVLCDHFLRKSDDAGIEISVYEVESIASDQNFRVLRIALTVQIDNIRRAQLCGPVKSYNMNNT